MDLLETIFIHGLIHIDAKISFSARIYFNEEHVLCNSDSLLCFSQFLNGSGAQALALLVTRINSLFILAFYEII